MSTTTNLGITEISSSQTQKEVTANTAFDSLDKVVTDLYTLSVAGAVDITANATTATFSRRIKLTGAITANINLIVPTLKKEYIIDNQTTGKFTVTVKPTAGTGIATYGTGWGHAAGDIRYLYCDGTNVVSGDSRLGGRPDATLALTTAITLPTLAGHQMVFVSTPSGADVAITLPSPTAGARITLKKTDSAAHNVVVTATIDGATNFNLAKQHETLTVEGDGSNWKIIDYYNAASYNTAAVSHQWIDSIVNGLPHLSQPAFSDVSGTASTGQIPDLSATYQATAGLNSPGANGYPGFVAAPSHFNDTGTAGQLAVDGTNFYVCLASNFWLQITDAGVFSTAF